MKSDKIFVISGPTASGKSALALEFALKNNGAIINADAMQIYQELPILSAQPTRSEQKSVPHLLYSYLKAEQSCSVALWLKLAAKAIKEVRLQNRVPIIVGGTGMYISKLFDGINETPQISDEIRSEARALYERLRKEDFIANLIAMGESENISSLDKQRLIRLYEVLKQSKKPLKQWQDAPRKFIIDPVNLIHVNLEIERRKLYENCNLRFKGMFEGGAVQEVRALIEAGIKNDAQVSKTLGFNEIKGYLSKNTTKDRAIELASQKTRNYAKRQLTWFRNQCKNKNVFDNLKDAFNFLQQKL